MNRTSLVIFILLVSIGAFGLANYFKDKPTQELSQPQQLTPPPKPLKKPIVHYPVPEPVLEQPSPPPKQNDSVVKSQEPQLPESLPSIHESDQSIQSSLGSLFENNNFTKLLFMDNFIQKFVATIDNLPEKRLPRAHLPIKAPGGKFLVSGTVEAPQTSSRNNKRYSSYVIFLESIDLNSAMKIYTHFYPLFQTAYEQLGYQHAYFNDRLVYVLDNLLETPNTPDPIQLAQPAVLFTYADPQLERLSSGQKVLLRIGQEQRQKVITILKQYRKALTNLQLK